MKVPGKIDAKNVMLWYTFEMKEVSAARKEYTHQLKSIMVPIMYERLKQTYLKAKKKDSDKSPLVEFQLALREYKEWSSLKVQNELAKMTQRASYFEDLITAIFVTSVRIMSAVQLGGAPKRFSLDPPSPESFVHTAYIRTARALYYKPYLFDDSTGEALEETREEVEKLIREGIEESIRSMLPVKSILESYLTTETDATEAPAADSTQNVEHPSRLVAEADEIQPPSPIRMDDERESSEDEGENPDSTHDSRPREGVDEASTSKGKEPMREDEESSSYPTPPSDIKEVRLGKDARGDHASRSESSSLPTKDADPDEPFFSDAEDEASDAKDKS